MPRKRIRIQKLRFKSHLKDRIASKSANHINDLLYGVQSVLSALRHEKRSFEKLYLKNNANFSERLKEIREIADKISIPVSEVSNAKLSEMCSNSVHQGVVLDCSSLPFSSIGDFSQTFSEKDSLIVALDQIEDPHNLGAILRTCGFYNVGAVVVPRDHTSRLSAVVSKASAGVAEWFPVISVTNMARFLIEHKSKGFWVVGMEENAIESLTILKRDRPLIIVFGNEGRGIRHLVKNSCDNLYRIPGNSEISSLNVSNAAAVVLSHLSEYTNLPK